MLTTKEKTPPECKITALSSRTSSPAKTVTTREPATTLSPKIYAQRRDRHGRPFGERVSQSQRMACPLKNKITPALSSRDIMRGERAREPYQPYKTSYSRGYAPQRDNKETRKGHDGQRPRSPYPRYTASGRPDTNAGEDANEVSKGVRKEQRETNRSPNHRTQSNPTYSTPTNSQHGTTQPEDTLRPPTPSTPGALNLHQVGQLPPRPPLEMNLYVSDFSPPPNQLPIMEEVMEELREVTFQYTNCPDPTESAARRQRVLDSESRGLMEETAARIVDNAKATAMIPSPAQQLISFQPEDGYAQTAGREITFGQTGDVGPSLPIIPVEGSTRPGRPPKNKKNMKAQRKLLGANLKKHN